MYHTEIYALFCDGIKKRALLYATVCRGDEKGSTTRGLKTCRRVFMQVRFFFNRRRIDSMEPRPREDGSSGERRREGGERSRGSVVRGTDFQDRPKINNGCNCSQISLLVLERS